MIHRQNNVLLTDADGNPDFAASYTVIGLPVGAVASAASSGSTATVDAGHGFQALDKVLIYDGTTATFVAEALTSVTGTTLVWSSATPTIADTNLLCNLGPDTASGSVPAFDASPMFIFTDLAGADVITNSLVTTDTTGNYDYWTNGDGRNWELIRDASGTVAGVVPGWGGVSGQLNPCDFGCRAATSTDNQQRIQVAFDAAADSGKVFRGPSGTFRSNNELTLKANFKAVNDTNFLLLRNFQSPNNGVTNGFVYNVNAATGSDDNIHWEGGRLGRVSSSMDGDMIQLWSDGGTLKNFVMESFGGSTTAGRGIVHRGDNFLIDNVRLFGDTGTTGNGGIRTTGGNHVRINNCDVKSGDDCYAPNTNETGVWSGASINDIQYNNCTGESTAARVFACGILADTGSVTRCVVNNMTGKSAVDAVVLKNIGGTGNLQTFRFNNCAFECCTDNGTDESLVINHDGVGSGVLDDVVFNNCSWDTTTGVPVSAAFKINGASATEGPTRIGFDNCYFDGSLATGSIPTIRVEHTTDFRFTNNHVKCGTDTGIRIGNGTNTADWCKVIGNHITDLATSQIGMDVVEADNSIFAFNTIRIESGATSTTGISEANAGATNNIFFGNDCSECATPFSAVSGLNEGSLYGYNRGHLVGSTTQIRTFTSADATPSVKDGLTFKTAGTTAITNFTDPVEGQEIRILAESSITITDGANIILNGSTNFAMVSEDTLTLLYDGSAWREVARNDMA